MTEDVCRSYMGNLEGKFYKLEGLSEEDQAELAKVDGLMSVLHVYGSHGAFFAMCQLKTRVWDW